MMDNMQLIKDVIEDLGNEVDVSYTEIDKLRLGEQRIKSNVDEMQ